MASSSGENSRPKLPLPVLEEVCSAYLDAIASFTPDMSDSQAHAEELKGRRDLLEVIEARDARTENWAYDWWLSDMYLDVSLPLPLNSNPGMVFPRLSFPSGSEVHGMCSFATGFTLGLIDFKKSLENGSLPPEMDRSGSPLCMKQYERLLNFYRKPGIKKDEHLDYQSASVKDEEIVIVMVMGQIYKLTVKKGGEWMSGQKIYRGLRDIYEEAERRDVECEVAILTSEDRRVWGGFYEELLGNNESNNASNLKDIARSLFVLCFDQVPSETSEEEDEDTRCFRQILSGTNSHLGNRWFDKTLQIIVCPNGVNGLCYEHSPAEGVAVVNTLTNIIGKVPLDLEMYQEEATASGEGRPEAFKWALSPEIRKGIDTARDRLEKANNDLDVKIFVFEEFGKDFIKGIKCSPDGFTQLALQLTYFTLYGSLCPTYESASTRRYASGRVDCIRSSHPEALAWVKTMTSSSPDNENRLKSFSAAMSKQAEVIRSNISGHGLDIPLLGLRKAAEESGKLPALFTSKEYAKSNAFTLTTSQIPIGIPGCFMAYGPVVADGWGAAYNIRPMDILIVISRFKSGSPFSANRFAQVFKESLISMKNLFKKA